MQLARPGPTERRVKHGEGAGLLGPNRDPARLLGGTPQQTLVAPQRDGGRVAGLLADPDVVVFVERPCRCGIASYQECHRLDLVGQGDHVDRLDLLGVVAELGEVDQIARERIGIARHVGDGARSDPGDRRAHRGRHPSARWIGDDDVEGSSFGRERA